MEKYFLTAEERLDMLSKPLWDYKDIAKYFGINKNKAIEIKKAARKESGNLPKYDPSKAPVEAVLKTQALNIDAEARKLKIVCGRDESAPAYA